MGALELGGQQAELLERAVMVGLGPGAAQPALDGRAVALEDVPLAVELRDGDPVKGIISGG
jgi:hypothetical protein